MEIISIIFVTYLEHKIHMAYLGKGRTWSGVNWETSHPFNKCKQNLTKRFIMCICIIIYHHIDTDIWPRRG